MSALVPRGSVVVVPAGIWTTSQSRLRVTVGTFVMGGRLAVGRQMAMMGRWGKRDFDWSYRMGEEGLGRRRTCRDGG